MFAHIVRREILEHLLSYRTLLAASLCFVLVGSSTLLMLDDYASRRAGYDHRDRVGQTQAGKRPKLTREPSPLSVLVRGLDAEMGRLVFITWAQPRRDPGARVLDAGDRNLLPSLFEPFDFAHTVGYVLSLLAMFFSFDAVCGERASGTLRVALSHGVRRSVLLMGKWVGGQVTMLACLGPAVAAVAALVGASADLRLDGEAWLRIGVLLLLSALYVSLFFSLGLLASSRTHRPATALQVLLFVWAVWVLGIPNTGILAARALRPVPDALDVERAKGAISLKDYPTETEYFQACWKLDDAYVTKVVGQANLSQALSRPSPLASYLYAASALAWTGVPDAHDFRDQVIGWDRRQREAGYFWEGEIPFYPGRRAFEDTMAQVWPDLGLLIGMNALLLFAAIVSFSRYDAR